jgi:hypothetical protein
MVDPSYPISTINTDPLLVLELEKLISSPGRAEKYSPERFANISTVVVSRFDVVIDVLPKEQYPRTSEFIRTCSTVGPRLVVTPVPDPV